MTSMFSKRLSDISSDKVAPIYNEALKNSSFNETLKLSPKSLQDVIEEETLPTLRIRDTCYNDDTTLSKSRKSQRVFVSESF